MSAVVVVADGTGGRRRRRSSLVDSQVPSKEKPRPGEATTYIDLAREFSDKWRQRFQSQAEEDAKKHVARHAARKSAARQRRNQQLKTRRLYQTEEQEVGWLVGCSV